MKYSMKTILTCLLVSVVTAMTGCATTSKESMVYKGSPKHTQASLAVLPSTNSYNLNQKLDTSTQKN